MSVFAQVGINTDQSTPDPSAGLDVKFTNKGFLPPRMTFAERNAISSPAEGLVVICTNCKTDGTGCISMYLGGQWLNLAGNCDLPATPATANLVPTNAQIIWNWNPVPIATGYKWNFVNNYLTATDMGTATTKTETGLNPNIACTRYVWSYNACGNSTPVTLTQTTLPNPPVTKTAITWYWNTVPGATGYKWNSVNNESTAINVGNNTFKNETGLTCHTAYTRYVWSYNSGSTSLFPVTLTQTTLGCFDCGISLNINHLTSGGVAPVDKAVTYVTVNGIPGELTNCWIDRNLGASQQPTVVNDAAEASAGWYFQFNRKQGYQYISSRIPSTIWTSFISENSDWTIANDPCAKELGTGWRIPTQTEWSNVDASGGWTDWNGPFGSALKIHAAGFLVFSDGLLSDRGSYGYYWSSTQSNATLGWNLSTSYWGSFLKGYDKPYGFSNRCVNDY
jgi:hypothetical protein